MAAASSRLPPAHPIWILSSSLLGLVRGHVANPILSRLWAGRWRMGRAKSERGQGEERLGLGPKGHIWEDSEGVIGHRAKIWGDRAGVMGEGQA